MTRREEATTTTKKEAQVIFLCVVDLSPCARQKAQQPAVREANERGFLPSSPAGLVFLFPLTKNGNFPR
jgi:hypothetical protein